MWEGRREYLKGQIAGVVTYPCLEIAFTSVLLICDHTQMDKYTYNIAFTTTAAYRPKVNYNCHSDFEILVSHAADLQLITLF